MSSLTDAPPTGLQYKDLLRDYEIRSEGTLLHVAAKEYVWSGFGLALVRPFIDRRSYTEGLPSCARTFFLPQVHFLWISRTARDTPRYSVQSCPRRAPMPIVRRR